MDRGHVMIHDAASQQERATADPVGKKGFAVEFYPFHGEPMIAARPNSQRQPKNARIAPAGAKASPIPSTLRSGWETLAERQEQLRRSPEA